MRDSTESVARTCRLPWRWIDGKDWISRPSTLSAPVAPQGEGASKLGRNMAKLRAAGLAIGAASGMQGLAEARGSGDEDYAPLGPVLYSALGRKAALEMVAAAQLACGL